MRSINRRLAFALLGVAYFITTIDMTCVNVALPTIGHDLHFGESDLQWVATAYALMFGGFLLLGGRFADLLGRRKLLLTGLAGFTLASLGCGLATDATLLIAMRGAQGLGAALMIPAALSIVMNLFSAGAERNQALGIWGGLGAAGGTVGLIAGGVITRYLGWEYIFFLNVPIGLVSFVLIPRTVPADAPRTGHQRFDLAGAFCGTGGLIVLVDALSQAPTAGWSSVRTIVSLALAVSLLAGFVIVERRVKDPLVPLEIFRARSLATANVAALLVVGAWFAFVFAGTLYMQQILHYSALSTGAAWMAASLTSMAMAGVAQRLTTRFGPRPIMVIGMTLIGVGILGTSQASAHAGFVTDLLIPYVIGGAGTALAFIPISVAALDGVAADQSGLASGLLNTSQQCGAAIATAIASTVLSAGGLTAFHTTFWILGAVALTAPLAVLTLSARRAPRPTQQPASVS